MEENKQPTQAIVIGAGPAGLTAAYELLEKTDIHPVVVEATAEIGGISRTISYHGNRMDIGGHRFFSKNEQVMQWWNKFMPLQGAPACDDILLDRKKDFESGGPDPEKTDRVMLIRQRVSRIFFLKKFFDYPVSVKWQTFKNLGFWNTLRAGLGYFKSVCFKRNEDSLEAFYINRFGKPLYQMFFEGYTEKVWGVHPSRLGADWGAQRVKGLSLTKVVSDMFRKVFRSQKNIEQKNVETSLIEQFIYPKLGPGQLWETVASDIQRSGGELLLNSPVKVVNITGKRITSVVTGEGENEKTIPCDSVFSSMAIKDLIMSLRGMDIPDEIVNISQNLPYRDFITVGLLVDKLLIANKTNIKTINNIVPDTWIYIQERDVKIGRLQIFNNWSPYMVSDYRNKVWIGLEYFCTEGDELWNMSDDDFIRFAIDEVDKIQIIRKEDVQDSTRVKVKRAYPSYFGSYYQLDKVITFLNQIENLYCIGRNGQHRYNNMDHSMLTAMIAVDSIRTGDVSAKEAIWNVNTETDYHEKK